MKLRALTGSMDWEYLRDEVPVALERSAIGVRRAVCWRCCDLLTDQRRASVADINAAVRTVWTTRPYHALLRWIWT